MQRWSRNGRRFDSGKPSRPTTASSLQISRTFRNVSLTAKARELVDLGDLNIECYDMCYKAMCEIIEEVKSKRPKPDGLGHEAQVEKALALETSGATGSS